MSEMTKYDAIIIGFGKGGKTMAGTLAAAGKKTAMIEQSSNMYGGTCINVGCIPTKSLVYRSGRAASKESFEEKAEEYTKAMEQKEKLTSMLRNKNYHKLADNPNVDVIDGKAKFVSPHVVEVEKDGKTQSLEAELILINTGATAFVPPIEGVKESQHVYTSEGLLSLKELPRELVIIGGGYIGVEFSAIYAGFGSHVSILQDGGVFLPREDADIAEEVRKSLKTRGVDVLTGVKVKAVEESQKGTFVVIEKEGETQKLKADAVLVATGRRPATEGLNLAAAGVETDARGGIKTDDSLATTAPHIYAMGDVRGGLQFTYLSLDDYRIVRSKILGDGSYTLKERGAVPYSVFLTPPFSRVGLSEKEALEQGYKVKTFQMPVSAIPKAQVLEHPEGLLKAVIDEETGLILGAHLFCEESHELINLIKLAMDAKIPYTVLKNMIFTHPTMGEAFNDLFSM